MIRRRSALAGVAVLVALVAATVAVPAARAEQPFRLTTQIEDRVNALDGQAVGETGHLLRLPDAERLSD